MKRRIDRLWLLERLQDKSVIKSAITPDHKDYAALMGVTRPASIPAASTPNVYAQTSGRAPVPGLPSWAN